MIGAGFAIAGALGLAGKFASGLMSAEARQGEFAQNLRALQMKKDQTISAAMARAAASGFAMESRSTTEYLAGLAKEFDIELDNMKLAKKQTGAADLISNLSGLVGGGASMYSSLNKVNNFEF